MDKKKQTQIAALLFYGLMLTAVLVFLIQSANLF